MNKLPRGKGFTSESGKAAGHKSRRRKAVLSQTFVDFMTGEGAEKAAKELNDLTGAAYVKHFGILAPYVYPRLASTTIDTEEGIVLHLNVDGELSKIISDM